MNRRRFIALLTGTTAAASLPLSVVDGIIAYTEKQYVALPRVPRIQQHYSEYAQIAVEQYSKAVIDHVMKENFFWNYMKRNPGLGSSMQVSERDPLRVKTRWDSSPISQRKWQSYGNP